MAEKHKSKYKAPKDLEKSQKPKPRKDLKDYSEDDKKGALNPKSAGEKQSNVLRKTDKEVVDTGDMFVKYNADDRLYKDLEDGEYDPKHAAKVLKKRQDADEKDNAKNIKDKIENLTREGKEQFVREYVRRKINMLLEQTAPEEPNAEEAPAPEAPAPEAPAPEVPTEPTPEAPAPDATAPAPDATAPTPDATAPAPEVPTEPTPEEAEGRVITATATEMSTEGGVGKIKMINKILDIALKDTDPEDKLSFFALLRSYAVKKQGKIQTK